MKQEEYLSKLLSFLKSKNKEIFIAWSLDKSLMGSFCSIENVEYDNIMVYSQEEGIFATIEPNKNILLRVNMLVSPILCSALSKDKNRLVLKILGMTKIDKEKRRFLRIYLDKPMDCTIIISNIFFPVKIVDISEGGAGVIVFSEKDLTNFLNKTGFIQINLFGDMLKLNMRFVWVSKISSKEYFLGLEFLLDNSLKNQIQKLMIDEMYNIEQTMLEFLSFL